VCGCPVNTSKRSSQRKVSTTSLRAEKDQQHWAIERRQKGLPNTSKVMSISRPARCLFSAPSLPPARPRIRCQNFHTTPKLSERRRPGFASVKARELFKRYTNEEKAVLAKIYTPEQIKAIEAGEDAISPEDLESRGVIRTDLGALSYLDDLSRLRPVIDKKPEYDGPIDPNSRLMTEEEMGRSLSRYLDKIDDENPPAEGVDADDPEIQKTLRPNRLDFLKAIEEVPIFMGTNGPLPVTPDQLAPGLPRKFLDEPSNVKKEGDEDEPDIRDPDGIYDKLRKQTGYTLDEILGLKVKILFRHRVVNVTRLGRIFSLYCLAIAGNQNGRLGIGEAKGQEAEETQHLARIAAIRNMQPIPRYEERTIFGEVEGKVSAVKVKLMARPPGMLILLKTMNEG